MLGPGKHCVLDCIKLCLESVCVWYKPETSSKSFSELFFFFGPLCSPMLETRCKIRETKVNENVALCLEIGEFLTNCRSTFD